MKCCLFPTHFLSLVNCSLNFNLDSFFFWQDQCSSHISITSSRRLSSSWLVFILLFLSPPCPQMIMSLSICCQASLERVMAQSGHLRGTGRRRGQSLILHHDSNYTNGSWSASCPQFYLAPLEIAHPLNSLFVLSVTKIFKLK